MKFLTRNIFGRLWFINCYESFWASLVAQWVKRGLQCGIPVFDTWIGKIPWRKKATYSSTLARKIPWTEEPGGLQSIRSQESDTTERLHFSLKFKACILLLNNDQNYYVFNGKEQANRSHQDTTLYMCIQQNKFLRNVILDSIIIQELQQKYRLK